MAFQGPKGTRDFYPEDMQVISFIFNTWKRTAWLFGFEEYEGPMFEHLDLFTKKSGEEIVKQLYNFKDKGDRDIALRPEITPTLARMIVARGSSLKKPVKWFSIPRLFRYERMQKGRLREFHQLNLDIIGEAGISADAELIAAVVFMMKSFCLASTDFKIRVNSRKLMSECLSALGFPAEKIPAAYSILDKKGKIEPEALQEMYAKDGIAGSDVQIIENLLACASLDHVRALVAAKADQVPALAEIAEFFSKISAYGLSEFVLFDIAVIRGLAYYTGIVFEVFDEQKSLRAIAGGGRYDALIEQFGGEPTPAVGFGMGDVVLYELLKEKNLIPQYRKPVDVYIINFNKDDSLPAISFASLLREKGVSCEFSLKGQNFKKQMEHAQHARMVAFVGGDEWKEGKVKIKDMGSGEEKVVEKDEAYSILAMGTHPPAP